MSKENSLDILDQLSSLCDDKSSLQARLALASFSDHSRDSILLEKGLMVFEYLQLVSSLLIATIVLNFDKDSAIFQAFFFVARLINPAYWMSFNKTGTFENMLFILVCIFTMVKVLLFLYILRKCLHSTEVPEGRLVTVWRFIMKFQSRVAYFYVSSFYIAAIRVIDWETYQTKDNQSIAFKVIALLLSVLELLLALVPKIYYHCMLPTKSFLSAKENTIEVITLLQKVFAQIMTEGLGLSLAANNWIFAGVNVCIDIFRISNFFTRLPLHHFRSLYFQGRLLMLVASLNMSYFISQIAKEVDPNFNSICFSLVLWGVLLCFGILVSNTFLKQAYWRIIFSLSLSSPNLLIHRVIALRELQKLARINCDQNQSESDFNLLVWRTFNSQVKTILWAEEIDPERLSMNILFKNFLEKLQDKFPRSKTIKIFLAEFYFKQMKVYGDPIKICLNLQQSRNVKLKINAELLLIRIQNQIKDKTLHHSPHLDLLNFVSEQAFLAKLKQDMLKQTGLQIEICSEIMKDSPNLEIIYQNSQKAHFYRGSIMAKINQISTKISDYNIEPVLQSAEYSLSLNHSIAEYINLTKLSSHKLRKYQKIFAQEKLCPENVFQENIGFFMISGVKGEAGKIIYATKQVGKILGRDSSQYQGLFLPQRTPPIFRRIFAERWKQLSENPETSSFGKINRTFFLHFDGYLVETEFFLDIHPFTTQGFSFIFIIRPVVSNREHLLLYENGDIDSASKGLIEKLGLRPQEKRLNIRDLNEEFGAANEALNMTAFPEKYGVEQLEETKEIYSKYTTDGVDIMLKCQGNLQMRYSYNCKMKNLAFGSWLIKVLTFEENKKENRTNEQLSPQQNASENLVTEEETPKMPYSPRTDRELLSNTQREDPRSTEHQLITSKSQTVKRNKTRLFINTLNRFDNDENQDGLPRLHSFSSDTSEEEEEEEEVIYRKVRVNKKLDQISQEKKISSLFQLSLGFKYHSKIFRGLTVGFYFSLAILIMLKFIAKGTSTGYMDSLVAKKDIFSNNAYRSYQLIETCGLIRYVWEFTSGAFNISASAAGLSSSKSFVMNDIQNLRETNIILLQASSILSREEGNAIYTKNVKVYNTYFDAPMQEFIMMDSLQATDRIIEAALAVYYSFFDPVFNPEIIPRAQFFFRNSLNDLILRSSELSETMLNSFDDQFSHLKRLSINFMVIFTVLLCVLFGVFLFFLQKQYSSDVFFISAVCKLNHNKIHAINRELINFQKHLKEKDDKDRNLVKSLKIREETNLSMSSRRETLKAPDNKALYQRYMKHALCVVVILLVLIAVILINALVVDTRLNKIKSAKEKLYFTNLLRIKISLASATFRELGATNNTAFVEDKQALDELESLIEQLTMMREEIYSTLLTEEVIQDNPDIKTLLLGDACSLLGSMFNGYCKMLEARGISRGFVYLMSGFEDILTEKVEDYKQSDKSAGALIRFQTKDSDILGVIYVMSLYEMQLLWTKVNGIFLSKVEADEAGRNLSLGMFLAGVLFVGITGWKYGLKGMGKNVNRLKNILRVFPAGLILSNFTLKAFLMKSSQVGLEFVRNEV